MPCCNMTYNIAVCQVAAWPTSMLYAMFQENTVFLVEILPPFPIFISEFLSNIWQYAPKSRPRAVRRRRGRDFGAYCGRLGVIFPLKKNGGPHPEVYWPLIHSHAPGAPRVHTQRCSVGINSVDQFTKWALVPRGLR